MCALLATGGLAIPGCAEPPADPPEIAPAPSEAAPVRVYRVREGDTLVRVASWYGVAPDALAWMNGIEAPDALAPGVTLRVPRVELPTHRIRSGETLGGLAAWYGVPLEALIAMNDIADVRRVPAGRLLLLPATRRRAEPPPLPAPPAGAGPEP